MKTAKKVLLILLAALTLTLSLTGCKYVTHYNAVGCVQSSTSKTAYLNFYEFKGRIVFKLKVGDEGGSLKYAAKLESGEATVYIDRTGEKESLLVVHGGDDVNDVLSGLEKGTVYVIIETAGKCGNGIFDFQIV